jgi:integrase/recombinase XerD
MSRGGLCQSIAKYNTDRGVKKTSLHLFRHTFAKMWLQGGGDIITLARVLTHSELEMVKRYANIYDTDVRDAIRKHSALSQLKLNTGKTLGSKSK